MTQILGGVGPASQVVPAQGAMTIVGLVVEIQRGQFDKPDALRHVGVGGTGEDIQLVPQAGEGGGGLAEIDPLAANPGVGAIGQEGDP